MKLKLADCTWGTKKPKKKHKVVKARRTIYYCTRKSCSWYMVPTLNKMECITFVPDEK